MAQALYTSGPLWGHMRSGITAAAIGMVAIFLVDLVDMAFIAQLGEPALAASIGFAGILLFATSAVGMALSVSASTLVSQALGRDEGQGAAQAYLDVCLVAAALGIPLALVLHFAAPTLLQALGAQGAVLDYAVAYFRIVNLALPLLLMGMSAGAGLRGFGLMRQSMVATLIGGAVNAIIDPILIFGLGWGLEGAAWATLISRIAVVAGAFYFAVGRSNLFAGARLGAVLGSLRPVFALGLPSLITSLSTALASAYMMRAVSPFGAEVVAGVSVFGRLMPLAFVGIITLAMAMAPIVGQNFGAGQRDRVERTLILAGGFSFAYALTVGVILAVCAPALVDLFNLTGKAAEVLTFYCRVIAFTYAFFGLHLAASQTFTNIGHPTFATYSNLGRDLGLMVPLVALAGMLDNLYAIILALYAATIIAGTVSYGFAFRMVHRAATSPAAQSTNQAYHRPVTPYAPSRGH